MKKKTRGIVSVVAGLQLLATAAVAQEAPIIARVVSYKVRPGMEQKFEDGMKRHNDFHAKQKDTGTHDMYVVSSGENTGTYIRMAPGRKWEDFDAEEAWAGQADAADSAVNLDPYVAAAAPAYYRFRNDLSSPLDPAAKPERMYAVIYFQVKQGRFDDMVAVLKRRNEALRKANWQRAYLWYTLVNGGAGGTFVLALPRTKWADFNPLPKAPAEVYDEVFGRGEADALSRLFNEAVEASRSEIVTYRPDLSHRPAR